MKVLLIDDHPLILTALQAVISGDGRWNVYPIRSVRIGEHELAAELTGSTADSAKRFSNLQITPNTSTQNYAFPRNATSAAVYDRVFNQLVAVFPTLEARRGLPMSYRWRCMACGPRQIETTTKSYRFLAAFEGSLGSKWKLKCSWDAKQRKVLATTCFKLSSFLS